MSFISELRRRNVIRVAIAYAVVAWFIVQAADVLLGNFGAPSWVFKTVTSLLALGFPLVLFLSWVYDVTPGGLQKTVDADAEAAGVIAPNIGRGIRAALIAGLVLMAGVAAWLTFRSDDPAPTATQAAKGTVDHEPTSAAAHGLRFSLPMPNGLEVSGPIAISSDGTQVAFQAIDAAGEAHIYLRRLNDFEPKQVEGSRSGRVPFFSPDGSAVGYFARGAIWRAATAGGPPTQLRAAAGLVGADWMMDDTIVYSTGVGSALQRMSADGAVRDALTTLGKGEYAHVWPQRIPGTDQLLFTLWRGSAGSWGGAQMLDMKTGHIQPLSGKPEMTLPPVRWSASGHLIIENFVDGLFAYPFDPAKDQAVPLGGASFLLGDASMMLQSTRSQFALSDTGVIAYVPTVQADRRLVRIQADGSTETILEQGPLSGRTLLDGPISVTRDGRQVLIGEVNILLVDLARKLPRPLSQNSVSMGNKIGATLSPNEREVYYRSNREERWKIWKEPIDGSAPPSVAVEHALSINDGTSIGPNAEIVFSVNDPATQNDIWLQDAAGTQRALMATRASERAPALSPDGATLAYVSDASGNDEVYLIAASGKGVPVQVTTSGGGAPKWSLDGRALLYSKGRNIFQIAVKDGQPAGEAAQRFAVDNLLGGASFALSPDGNSLYAVQLGEGAIPREIRVITDFFDDIERVTAEGDTP